MVWLFLTCPYRVISTGGGAFAAAAERPAGCLCRHYRLRKQPAGLSTSHDDKTIMLRSRWQFWGGSFIP